MYKILFPTDFSKASTNAFIYALDMAKSMCGSIDVLHIHRDLTNDQLVLPKSLQAINDEIELGKFEEFRNAIPELKSITTKNQYSCVDIRYILDKGGVEEKIEYYANNEDYDLLIMPHKGMSSVSNIFLGSTTSMVLHKVFIPILAIPLEVDFDGDIDHMLFMTDFKSDDIDSLRLTSEIAKKMKAELHCVHFDIKHTEEQVWWMDEWVKKLDFDTSEIQFKTIDSEEIETSLRKYCEEFKIDLVVMLSHQHNLIERIFKYSVTSELLVKSHIPLLSLKSRKDT